MINQLLILHSIFLALTFRFANAEEPTRHPIVWNGLSVTNDDPVARSIVRVRKPWFRNHDCTGVIVKPKQVVTAAHCTSGEEAIVEFVDPKSGRNVSAVSSSNIRFASTSQPRLLSNDFAVIQLERNVPAGFAPLPIGNLSLSSDRPFEPALIYAFGLTWAGQTVNYQPRYGNVLLVSAKFGLLFLKPMENHACPGDSGGAVVIKNSMTQLLEWVGLIVAVETYRPKNIWDRLTTNRCGSRTVAIDATLIQQFMDRQSPKL